MAYDHVYTCAHFPIQMFLYEVAGVLIVASLQPPEVQTVSICLEGCKIYNISVYVTEQRVADEEVIGSSSTEVSPLLGSGTMYMYTHITMYSRHTCMYTFMLLISYLHSSPKYKTQRSRRRLLSVYTMFCHLPGTECK